MGTWCVVMGMRWMAMAPQLGLSRCGRPGMLGGVSAVPKDATLSPAHHRAGEHDWTEVEVELCLMCLMYNTRVTSIEMRGFAFGGGAARAMSTMLRNNSVSGPRVCMRCAVRCVHVQRAVCMCSAPCSV